MNLLEHISAEKVHAEKMSAERRPGLVARIVKKLERLSWAMTAAIAITAAVLAAASATDACASGSCTTKCYSDVLGRTVCDTFCW